MSNSKLFEFGFDKPVLIFDRDCQLCVSFSKLAKKLGFAVRPIQESQDILKKLVGENFPFALYLLDSNGIFWGKYAAKRILEIKGLGLFSSISYVIYPLIASFNKNSRKINTCGCMMHGRIYFDQPSR